MIRHNRPWITRSDHRAVSSALSSGWIAYGDKGRQLEEWFESYLGSSGALTTSSGSSALFLALKGLGIGQGSLVAVPSYCCSAVSDAIVLAGATPLFVDNHRESLSADLADLPGSVEALVVVHTFGIPSDFSKVARPGLKIIEDCSHSLGGSTGGTPLGSRGDAAIFSFFASKIVTGGYGGLVSFQDQAAFSCASDYRNFDGRSDGHHRFNLFLGDSNSALVLSQIRRLNEIRERRLSNARKYVEVVPQEALTLTGPLDEERQLYRFVLNHQDHQSADEALMFLESMGIESIRPIQRNELLHVRFGHDGQVLEHCESQTDRIISVPVYPALGRLQRAKVVRALGELFR